MAWGPRQSVNLNIYFNMMKHGFDDERSSKLNPSNALALEK